MLCMHHMIPNRYNYPSGDSYSWMLDRDHGGNRTTKLCLAVYIIGAHMRARARAEWQLPQGALFFDQYTTQVRHTSVYVYVAHEQ